VPSFGYLIVKQAGANILKLDGQWNLSLNGSAYIDEGTTDYNRECVESQEFLLEHGVH